MYTCMCVYLYTCVCVSISSNINMNNLIYVDDTLLMGADHGSDHELLIAKFRLKESRENHEAIQV